MGFRSTVLRSVATSLIGLCLASGCSAPEGPTGPSEEPNVGPGGPAGAKENFKPVDKKGASPAAAPKTSSPAVAPKAAPEK